MDKEEWFRTQMTGQLRYQFYLELLQLAAEHAVRALFCCMDEHIAEKSEKTDHETFVTKLLLERIEQALADTEEAFVVSLNRVVATRINVLSCPIASIHFNQELPLFNLNE